MSAQQKDVWGYVIITILSVLIWFWAAGETRVERELPLSVQFTVNEPDKWIIEPARLVVTLSAEGSQRAIRTAQESLRELTLDIDPTPGAHTVEVAERLRNHPEIRAAGISVITTEPINGQLTIDQIVQEEATVVTNLPRGFEDIKIDPPQVDIAMPNTIRAAYPRDLVVEAFVNEEELRSLQRGGRHTLPNVRLRLPGEPSLPAGVRVKPTAVELSFTIRSEVTEHKLSQPVQVRIAASPEVDEFSIELEPKQLQDVTVSGSKEVIEEIRNGDTVVVAIVHLRFSEKEARMASKQVSCFLALRPDGRAEVVEARVGASGDDRPSIQLNITERDGSE